MNGTTWIICERGGRWTPALRLALERRGSGRPRWRIREVRQLAELTAELAARPAAIAAMEVHRGNLADALHWLASATREFPAARCVAFVDRGLAGERHWAHVCDALREAGASEVADSPRRLHTVLELGWRHSAAIASQFAARKTDNLSLAEQAWTALPWQDA